MHLLVPRRGDRCSDYIGAREKDIYPRSDWAALHYLELFRHYFLIHIKVLYVKQCILGSTVSYGTHAVIWMMLFLSYINLADVARFFEDSLVRNISILHVSSLLYPIR